MGVEESLFITYCDRLGHFYGQFDKRATAELKALEEELFSFYGKNCNKVSLYADHENHVGDPAVIKWAVDKQLYRVEILEELQGKKVTKQFFNSSKIFILIVILICIRFWWCLLIMATWSRFHDAKSGLPLAVWNSLHSLLLVLTAWWRMFLTFPLNNGKMLC